MYYACCFSVLPGVPREVRRVSIKGQFSDPTMDYLPDNILTTINKLKESRLSVWVVILNRSHQPLAYLQGCLGDHGELVCNFPSMKNSRFPTTIKRWVKKQPTGSIVEITDVHVNDWMGVSTEQMISYLYQAMSLYLTNPFNRLPNQYLLVNTSDEVVQTVLTRRQAKYVSTWYYQVSGKYVHQDVYLVRLQPKHRL